MLGTPHIVVLLLTAVSVAVLVWVGRTRPAHPWLVLKERVLVAALLLTYPVKLAVMLTGYGSVWEFLLPFQLCDVAAYLAAAALISRKQRLAELAYLWGIAGTLQGLLTPSVTFGFPHPEFFRFFQLHMAVVITALYLPFGANLVPEKGAVWRAFVWVQVYVVLALAVNAVTGSNYGFLREKPPAASLLDVLGPWPYYILSLELVALVFFWLLCLPFGRGRRVGG